MIVMGDMNAKIGIPSKNENDVLGKHGIGIRNDRGSMLINFARSQQLFIANTIFKKRPQRKWTWTLGRAKNEIDFIMVKQNQKHLVRNIDVVNGLKFHSDHRMIRMTMELKVKSFLSFTKHVPKIKVQEDEELLKAFNQNLKNNLTIDDDYTVLSIQEKYDKFCSSIITSAEPFRTTNKQDSVITSATKKEIDIREQLRRNRHENEITEIEFKKQRKKANRLIKRDVYRKEIEQLQYTIENGKSLKNAKNGLNSVKTWIPKLQDEFGNVKTNREEVLEVAASFYEKLFTSTLSTVDRINLDPELNDEIEVEEITIFEIESMLKLMKNSNWI